MIARFTATWTLAFVTVPASAQESCDDWNTSNFFIDATAETVAACLEAGADLNAIEDNDWRPEDRGNTPLHFASRYSWDRTVITVLLAAGANVGARNRRGATPLHVAAAAYRDPAVVAELMEAGADVNARDGEGNTPLHASWTNRNPAVAHLLLELGADRSAVNEQGQIADPMDCTHWNTEVFAHIATADAIAACLAAGGEVNARDQNGNTPLLFAVRERGGGAAGSPASEDPSVVALLLEASADVNARNDAGVTPLHYAAAGRSVEEGRGRGLAEDVGIVAVLLEAGADVNARIGFDGGSGGGLRFLNPGTTPLHRAALSELPETVGLLLEAGADIHARDSAGDTPLLMASYAGFGNPEVLEILVEAGADINDQDQRGASVLYNALRSWPPGEGGDRVTDVVRRLLDLGADATEPGLLHRAARHGDNPELIAVLLGAGADVSDRTGIGRSSLHEAALHGGPRVIGALFAGGAEVDAQDNRGTTPLHHAVEAKLPANVAALLEAGADVHVRGPEGDTPLHIAAIWPPTRLPGRTSPEPDTLMVIALVAAGADVNTRNERGETPLHVAVRSHHQPVVDGLLALGADPVAVDDLGRAPRPTVCNWTKRQFFQFAPWESVLGCLKAGADVHARGEYGDTPLHGLAEDGGTDDYPAARIVAAFVEAGADVNARNRTGDTPLHDAVIRRDATDLPAALLAAGADVNARGSGGRTPLHLAAGASWFARAAPSMITLLTEAGADVHATDSGGRTALHWALQSDKPAILSRLIELGSDVAARDDSGNVANPTDCARLNSATFFHLAPAEVVGGCIEGGADVRARSEGWGGGRMRPGSTPLHFASAWARDPAVVSLLIEAGADANAQDREGYSPLHRAAELNENPGMITVLLDAGAEVNAWASGFSIDWGWDYTPLHLAATNENPSVAAALLEAGANVNALNGIGTGTPLHQAAGSRSSPAVVALLIEAGADLNARAEVWDRCCWTTARDRTPLHLAAMLSPAVFMVLLDAGADPAALDDYGKTPMDYARENKALQELEVVKRSGR